MHLIHLASGREWRGGQRQTWLLARALAPELGQRQAVLTLRGSELARRLTADGVRVVPVAWRIGVDPRPLRPLLAEARRPAALIHAHDPHAMVLAAWAARRTGARLVASRRTAFPLRRPELWRRANRVLAVSQAIADRLILDGVAPDRITVIHSAVDLAAVGATHPAGIRQRLGLPADAPVVVTVAALTPEKGHRTLLAAAAALARSLGPTAPHWVLLGEGPLRPVLEQEAERLGLGDRVHLLGQVEDPLAYLADATLAVLPSQSEGLGTTLLDAMALGRPVVASAIGGIPELLAGGAGSLVPPGDPSALAHAVQELLTDPESAAAMARTAAERAGRFGVDRMAAATLSVYRSVAQNP